MVEQRVDVDAKADETPGARVGMASEAPELLRVHNLGISFRRRHRVVVAVDGLDYSVEPGRTLAIVGESGSGKTVSARAVMGLLPRTATVSGSIVFDGEELVGLSQSEMHNRRGRDFAMVFQNPDRALNPTMRVGTQIMEAIRVHLDLSRRAARERAAELLDRVRIPAARQRLYEYPHQLSGGMRQRVMIAMAIASNPRLLITDEATTALDVTTQAQIMSLLMDIQREFGMAIVMISHDLGLAAGYADDVLVMYAGRAVEKAPTRQLFHHMRMPYTRALLDAVPRLHAPAHQLLPTIEGQPPNLAVAIPGCPFAPRCRYVQADCREVAPHLEEHEHGHHYACFHPLSDER